MAENLIIIRTTLMDYHKRDEGFMVHCRLIVALQIAAQNPALV
jgi:hypothetical protein